MAAVVSKINMLHPGPVLLPHLSDADWILGLTQAWSQSIDKDNSGSITADELEEAMKSQGSSLDGRDLRNLLVQASPAVLFCAALCAGSHACLKPGQMLLKESC